MDSFGVAMETLRKKILNVVYGFSAWTESATVPDTHEHATALILAEVEPGYRAMWDQGAQLQKDVAYWRDKADEYQASAERWAATAEQKQQDVNNANKLLEKAIVQLHETEDKILALPSLSVTGFEERHPHWRNFVKSGQGELPEGTDFLSLAKNTLLDQVNAYVSEVELGAVKCRCEWLIHPEDAHLSPDQQRKRRGMESEFCATHSKRGLVLGLFEYLFGTEETVIPAEQTEARSRLYTEYQNRLRRRMVDHLRRKGYPDNQAQSIVHDFLPMIAGDFRGAWELVDYLKVQLIMQYTSPVTDIIGNNTGAPLGFLSTFDEVPPTRGLEMSDGSRHCLSQDPHAEHVWSGSESGAEFTATCPGTTEA